MIEVVIGATVIGLLLWAAARRRAAPPAPARPETAAGPLPHVLTTEEMDKLFGPLPWQPGADDSAIVIDPAWVATNLVTVEIPQLKGKKGAPASGKVTLHRAVADRVVAFFDAVEKAGLADRIVSWDGSYAPRRIRGSQSISKHAYGVAFDINAAENGLGTPGAPVGSPGSVVELVPLAREHGFLWGGDYKGRKDPMHFEAFR